MKRIATTEKAKETMVNVAVAYGIPGTSFIFKTGSVPCYTSNEEGFTIIYLPTFIMNKLINAIEFGKSGIIINYKDHIKVINDVLKTAGIDKHVRHELERELIRVWGGHENLKHIRRWFL